MGTNLDYGKHSFKNLLSEMDTTIKAQFVVWLDEKLAEYKVQGVMNFDTETIPTWLQDYSKSLKISGLPLSGAPFHQDTIPENVEQIHSERTADQTKNTETSPADYMNVRQNLDHDKNTEEKEVVMLLPEDVAASLKDYQQIEGGNITIQHRSMKPFKNTSRFKSVNSSYTAVLTARKKERNTTEISNIKSEQSVDIIRSPRLAETVVQPSQDEECSLQSDNPGGDTQGYHIDTDTSVMRKRGVKRRATQKHNEKIRIKKEIIDDDDDDSCYEQNDSQIGTEHDQEMETPNKDSLIEGETSDEAETSGMHDSCQFIKKSLQETSGPFPHVRSSSTPQQNETETIDRDDVFSYLLPRTIKQDHEGDNEQDVERNDERNDERDCEQDEDSELLETLLKKISKRQKSLKNTSHICSVCDINFATHGNYLRHLKTMHSRRKFACEICTKKFKRTDSLSRHKRGCQRKMTMKEENNGYNVP